MTASVTGMTPSELIRKRVEAFARGDFGFIYDSYHSDSNFRRQFPTRDAYLEVGQRSLSRDFAIDGCRILDEKKDDDVAQVIVLMTMRSHGQLQPYVERAWFVVEAGRWRYHRSQKIPHGELPQDPHSLTFEDFIQLDPDTIF